MRSRQIMLLRVAFVVGAATDAVALLPLLFPSVASLLWGASSTTAINRFTSGYAAALMLGWTALLVWAARSPLERRDIAALTVLVVYGLVAAEVLAVLSGAIAPSRLIPTWILQAGLLLLFAGAYHYPSLSRFANRTSAST